MPSSFHAQKEVNPVNDLAYRMALQKQIKRKFYGHDKLKSKHVPQYAVSAEQQYSQTFVNLAREMEKEVQKSLPKSSASLSRNETSRPTPTAFRIFRASSKGLCRRSITPSPAKS